MRFKMIATFIFVMSFSAFAVAAAAQGSAARSGGAGFYRAIRAGRATVG